MTSEAPGELLDRVRKLLAKAEDESVTPPEAEALTAKAAELMAKYGIDRALLAAAKPDTDTPASRLIDIDNPWGRVKAHLLCGLGSALRCQCIMLTTKAGLRVHVFGYGSDIERLDVLCTSVLIQMWHALAVAPVPEWTRSPPLLVSGAGRAAVGSCSSSDSTRARWPGAAVRGLRPRDLEGG